MRLSVSLDSRCTTRGIESSSVTLPITSTIHIVGGKPGEIYYISALTINLFGIVDLLVTPNKLNCYAYRESTGRKKSNNVVSMLHNFFGNKWLMKGNPGKRPTITMDNCGGEHKNNKVLHLAPYLVGIKFFQEVEYVFYIDGQTKNTCD
jgi:hypothetical protein